MRTPALLLLVFSLGLAACGPVRASVVVEWTTASEVNTAGFNLYRSESPDGPYAQDNVYLERPFLSVAEYGVGEPAFVPALEVIGSVPDTLDTLAAKPQGRNAWTSDALARFRQGLAAFLTPSLDHTQLGLSPARLFGRLRDLTPRDTILTVDTGAHKLLISQLGK